MKGLKKVVTAILATLIAIVLTLLGSVVVILFTVLPWILAPLFWLVVIGVVVYLALSEDTDQSSDT